jgi:hypothetical protein
VGRSLIVPICAAEPAVSLRIYTRWGDLQGNPPMRDWLLVILPVALVFYFIEYPDQLKALIEWLSALARHVQ